MSLFKGWNPTSSNDSSFHKLTSHVPESSGKVTRQFDIDIDIDTL